MCNELRGFQMTLAHFLLPVLTLTGLVIATWLLQVARQAWTASGNADHLLLSLVPFTALMFVVVGTLTVREVVGARQVGVTSGPQVPPSKVRFIPV